MDQHLLPAEPAAALGRIDDALQASICSLRDVEAQCKAAFLPLLRDHGFARVEILYDGGGDEGSMAEVRAYAGDQEAELPAILCDHHSLEYDGRVLNRTVDLSDALSAFAENAVCARHCGWENGEGAYGTIVIDVASGSVALTHNTRFINYETSEAEL